jgi:hypothetical protein
LGTVEYPGPGRRLPGPHSRRDLTFHRAGETGGGFYFPDSPRTELFLNGENVGRRGGKIPDQWYSSDLWTSFGLKFIDEALAAKWEAWAERAQVKPYPPTAAKKAGKAKGRARKQ